MLDKATTIHGYKVGASDGQFGTVADLLFDDQSWRVRWLIVETGSWMNSRRVLLPPSAFGHLDPIKKEFSVRLSQRQLRDSPDVNTELPVSRQMESSIYDYYGWNPYWGGEFYLGGYEATGQGLTPFAAGAHGIDEQVAWDHLHPGDPHLRSVSEVSGYHVHATDGDIGHVADFLMEDGDWSLRYLVVDTSNWWLGKKVLISPRSVRMVDWSTRFINLGVTRQRVQDSPPYDPTTQVHRDYERQFHAYYRD